VSLFCCQDPRLHFLFMGYSSMTLFGAGPESPMMDRMWPFRLCTWVQCQTTLLGRISSSAFFTGVAGSPGMGFVCNCRALHAIPLFLGCGKKEDLAWPGYQCGSLGLQLVDVQFDTNCGSDWCHNKVWANGLDAQTWRIQTMLGLPQWMCFDNG